MNARLVLSFALALILALPLAFSGERPPVLQEAAAQEAAVQRGDVARQAFRFLDSRLTVEVTDEIPGVLRLVRGTGGTLEVAARTPGGIPAFGLERRGMARLTLTTAAEEVEYVVVVPADTRIRVELPDRRVAELLGRTQSSATYTWGGRGS